MTDTAATVDFFKQVFGPATSRAVFVCSLPNDRNDPNEPGERRLMTRDLDALSRFVAKWDRPGRALYFCVGTLQDDAQPASPGGSPRSKANVAEIHMLQADVDLKDIDVSLDEVVARVSVIPKRPSVIVRSGRGLHLYWLLNEAIEAPSTEDVERVEAALRQLGDLVGGDLQVAEVARLMRVPGSHNTKDGAWTPVTVEVADYGRRYELDDIEEMLSYVSPVVHRRKSAIVPADANPFLDAAKRLGFKPPLDVERALSVMSYQGAVGTSIHETQLKVSASLLNQGIALEEVVDVLIGATKGAAGEYGARWNWTREERAIRRMCEDWLRKHPVEVRPEPRQQAHEAREAVGGGSVVNLSDARAKRAKAKAPKGDDKVQTHVVLGTAVIDAMEARGERLLVTAGQIWRYADGLWSTPLLDGRRWLEVEIEIGCRALNVPSTSRIVNETRQWLLRHPDLYRNDVAWDAHGRIPTRSGLVDPKTGIVEAPRAEHFSTWRMECSFDANASCPWWRKMVSDFFGDRSDEARSATIDVLQEAYGMALLENKPRSLTRALVFQGGSEAGKSQVIDILSGLLGTQPISTPLESLDGAHGTMEFLRRAPWVLHEAFDQGRWHFSSKVKQILSGDPIQINVKSGPLLTQRVRSPVFWGTNHPPQFKEATTAIINRMIVFKCRSVFSKDNPVGVAAEARRRGFSEPRDFILAEESSGLLNWAMEGMRRALERGYLLSTPEIDETLNEVRSNSNMVAGFIEECVSFTSEGMVSVPDFCAAFAVWWGENKGEDRRSPSNDAIGRAMSSLGDARIGTDRNDLRDASRRYYAGIHLNDIGSDYWNAAATEGHASGKTARITTRREDVNRRIPDGWADRGGVRRLRQAFMRPPDPDDTSRDTSDDTYKIEVSSDEKCHDTSPRF